MFAVFFFLPVPVSRPTLTVIPPLPEISEGHHLYLICGLQGTPPVTFKWYRVGNEQPLFTTTSNNYHTNYQVSGLTKQHSGTYYCEASNHANNVVRSKLVKIEGKTEGYTHFVGNPALLWSLIFDVKHPYQNRLAKNSFKLK